MEVESTGLTGKKIRFNTVDKKKVEADTSFFTSYLMVQKIPASSGDLEIPIEFSSASLLKAIEYLKYHKNQQRVLFIKPLPDRDYFYNTVDSWDKNFIESLNLEELLELIQVADKLNIETLSDFCAAYVANYFKDRTWEEIRQEYSVEEKLNSAIEEEIKSAYKPIFDSIKEQHKI